MLKNLGKLKEAAPAIATALLGFPAGPLVGHAITALGGDPNTITTEGALDNLLAGVSPEAAKAAEERYLKLVEGVVAADAANAEQNRVDSVNGGFLKAGWRPMMGWVCVLAFAYHYLLQPFLEWGVAVYAFKSGTAAELPQWPRLDLSQLDTILFGMLGLGSLRTLEKSGAQRGQGGIIGAAVSLFKGGQNGK